MNKNLEQLWRDEKHWRFGSIYICKQDPRIVVRKKRKWAGWTFNFAHRASFILLILILLIAGVPANFMVYTNQLYLVPQAIMLSAVIAIFVTYLFSKIGREHP